MELWQVVTVTIVAAVIGVYFLVGFIIQRFTGRVECESDRSCSYDPPHGDGVCHSINSSDDRVKLILLWGPALVYGATAEYGLPAVKRAFRWLILGV